MICPKCGNQLAENIKFCSKCGTAVAAQMQANPQPMQRAPMLQQGQGVYGNYQYTPQMQQKPSTPKKTKKTGWKIGDLILKIIAIIVGVSVVTTFVLVFVDSWMYIEETAGCKSMRDFPVLRQDTMLTVYDEENFPTEIYEIKVEKYENDDTFFKSRAFNKRERVVKEISMSKIYTLHFPEDGKYRITITDLTESISENADTTASYYNEGEETTKDDTDNWKIVVIEVVVEDDNDDAFDKVTLRSTDTDKPTEETTRSADNGSENNETQEIGNILIDDDVRWESVSFDMNDSVRNHSECETEAECIVCQTDSFKLSSQNKAVTESYSFIFCCNSKVF